ncbi:MAG: hypothetical protein HY966_01455 [Ignavibacteriales bacterium]|nr:hypothetical protein [Ignavibacteriales bacterium]
MKTMNAGRNQFSNVCVVWLFITAHLCFVCGCTSTVQSTVDGDEIPVAPNLKVVSVIMKSGEIVHFDAAGGRYVERNKDSRFYKAIVGNTEDHKYAEIETSSVVETKIEQKQASGMGSFAAGFLLGMPAGALGLYLGLLAASSR